MVHSAPQQIKEPILGSINPPKIAAKPSVTRRYDQVKVIFTRDVYGTRVFPLPSKHKYRFDAGSHKERVMPRYDADELVSRYPNTFEIVEIGVKDG